MNRWCSWIWCRWRCRGTSWRSRWITWRWILNIDIKLLNAILPIWKGKLSPDQIYWRRLWIIYNYSIITLICYFRGSYELLVPIILYTIRLRGWAWRITNFLNLHLGKHYSIILIYKLIFFNQILIRDTILVCKTPSTWVLN